MDTLRSIGTSADELKQKIFDLGSLAKETSYHFQEFTKQKSNAINHSLDNQKTKEELATSSEWTHQYDTNLIQSLQNQADLLEAAILEKREKLKNAEHVLEKLKKNVHQAKLEYAKTENAVVEQRRRFELFLGLRFGKVFPGEIRFFFNHIDPANPAKEFQFSIRTEGRINRIVDCDPDVGDRYKPLEEKLREGRLSITQVVCEMRYVFKSLLVTSS